LSKLPSIWSNWFGGKPTGIAAAILLVLTAATLVGRIFLPDLVVPAGTAIDIGVDADGAVCLLLMLSVKPRLSLATFFLALAFLSQGIVTAVMLQLIPSGEPQFASPALGQMALWANLFGLSVFLAYASCYMFVRPSYGLSAPVAITTSLITFGLIGAVLWTLPQWSHTSAGEPVLIACSAFLLILFAIVSIASSRTKEPNALNRSLTFALFALTAGLALSFAPGLAGNGHYAAAILSAAAAFFVLIGIVGRLLFDSRVSNAVEIRLAENTSRLAALWEIANVPRIDDRARLLAMLEAGAAALRPGQAFYGQLSYQQGQTIVLIAGARAAPGAPVADPDALLAQGVQYPIADGPQADVLAAGGTIGWHDVRTVAGLSQRKRVQYFRDRAIIGSTFFVDDRPHFLVFYSAEPAEQPFTQNDCAYIEVLASFFATHLQRSVESASNVRLAQNTSRLSALWEIATAPRADGRARLLAMLDAGASALRPEHAFHGQLSYQDGAEIVIAAGARPPPGVLAAEAERLLVEGVRFPGKDGIQSELIAAGCTVAWDDTLRVPRLAENKRLLQFRGRAVIGTAFHVGERTHFLIFFSSVPASPPFTQDDIAFVDVLASFFASHLHLGAERTAELQLAQNAGRLTALWEIARAPRVDDRTRMLATLEAGATGLRPEQSFHGQLCYQDGDEIVIVAGARISANVPTAEAEQLLARGVRYPSEDGVQSDVLAHGGTIGWDDVQRIPALARRKRIALFGGRAVIGSTFRIGDRVHFLMYYSAEPATPPFTQDDYAYIDVLASFFASHLRQNTENTAAERLAQNAQRLTALWEIATTQQVDERTRLLATLAAGASGIRPGQTFHGQLSYRDGNELVVVAGVEGERDSRSTATEAFLSEGARALLENGVHSRLLTTQGVIGWPDARSVPELANLQRIRDFDIRAIIASTFRVGERTYFLVFFSFEAATQSFTQDDYAYVDVLTSFFASSLHRRTEKATEIRLAQHVVRLEAFRAIATAAPGGDDKTRHLAMLVAGARSLRSNPVFHGQLSYLDGEDVVVIAGSRSERDWPAAAGERLIDEGGRYRLADSVQAEVLKARSTIGWDDARLVPALQARSRARAIGWGAIIATTFRVGARTYFLTFGSFEAAREPFTLEDCAYVDVLASLFATTLQQSSQRERIRTALDIDRLTGLPTRATFRASAMQTMSSTSNCAIVIVDVDRFRTVVETVGHQTADALLVELAATFASLARPGECVARLGGDTFAILMTDVESLALANERARELVTGLKRQYSTGDGLGVEHIPLSASAGLAFIAAGDTFEKAVMNAEAALAAAKQVGLSSSAIFNEDMAASHAQRLFVRSALPAAIEDGQLTVVYQPTIALSTMRVCGAEALVRWTHPERGLIAAADFLPFAWENGLSSRVGRFVINRVAIDAPILCDHVPEFRTYFNLSARELADDAFLGELQLLLFDDRSLARRLGIEISEDVAMRDPDWTLGILGKLKRHGLRVAIDNFGTGSSALANLKKLPLDVLKIDGDLIRGLPHDRNNVAIVEALLAIAEKFGCETIAKGVETVEQLTWLQMHGCTMAQGFRIARPMDVATFLPWLLEREKTPTVA